MDLELAKTYYEHQYRRVTAIEERRVNFTSIVGASSGIVLAILAEDQKAISNGELLVSVVVAISNLVAIGHTVRTSQHIDVHLSRARYILEKLDPELAQINADFPMPIKITSLHSSRVYQVILHAILIAAALVIPIIQ